MANDHACFVENAHGGDRLAHGVRHRPCAYRRNPIQSRVKIIMLIPFLQRADYGHRASGFYVCPNHLAGVLEVLGIIGLSITCWSRWPVWSKLLIGYLVCVCYAGVALTGSRGGYLSVAASLIVFAILSLTALSAGGRNLLSEIRTERFGSAHGGLDCGRVFVSSELLPQRPGRKYY